MALMRTICLFSILTLILLQAGPLKAQEATLVLVGEGLIEISSKCNGDQTKTALVRLPQDAPYAYADTKLEILSANGKRNVFKIYNPKNQTVAITASAGTNNDCGCIGPICNEPSSWISVKYMVFAQKNSCDPEPVIPDPEQVSAQEYESAIKLSLKSKSCQDNVLEIKQKKVLSKIDETVKTKASAKYDEAKLNSANEIAEVQTVQSDIESFAAKLNPLSTNLVELANALDDMWTVFNKSIDFFQADFSAHLRAAEYENTLNDYISEKATSPGLEKLRKALDITLTINEPPPATFFSTTKWLTELQEKYEIFKSKHARQSRELEALLLSENESLKRIAKFFNVVNILDQTGFNELQSHLIQYKAKADEIYAKAVENQESLKKVQDLATRSINKWLCSKFKSKEYCEESNCWNKELTLWTPVNINGPLPINQRNIPNPFPTNQPFPRIPLPPKRNPLLSTAWSLNSPQQTCFTIEFYADYDSEMTPVPLRDGISFITFNGREVNFYIDQNSFEYSNGKVIRSRSTGCINSEFFKFYSNDVALKFVYGEGQYLKGYSRTVLYSNYGSQFQNIICQEEMTQYTQGSRQCSGTMVIDLQKLDPTLKQKILDLKHEARRLDLEIKGKNEKIKILQNELDNYAAMDLDNISADDLRGISSDLEETARFLENIQLHVTIEREKVLTELSGILRKTQKTNLDDLLSNGYKDLSDKKLLGPIILPDLNLLEMQYNAYIAGSNDNTDLVSIEKTYEDIGKKVENSFQENLNKQNFETLDYLQKNWKMSYAELFKRLRDRDAGPRELEAFGRMAKKINGFISTFFDENGFYKPAGIPEDIKLGLAKVQNSEDFVEKARIAMNKIRQESLNADEKARQVNFYMLMRSYDELFGYDGNRNSRILNTKDRKDIENGLLAIAESGFRIGVSFTPYGKFVDFCEFVTGQSLCTPNGSTLTTSDRALAGLGIFLASGAALKSIAESKIIRESANLSLFLEGYNGLVKKLKVSITPTAEGFENVGIKILRLFGINKPLSVAE
ncbi:MAG: hypothetical protein ACXVCY_17960, partial [Pseudobdellovibrionaceae bacterium]